MNSNKQELSAFTDNGDKGSLAYLSFVCIVSALGGLLFGFDTYVVSGARGLVVKQFQLGAAMEGWFVASATLGCVIGAAIAGTISDRYGRKKVLILSGILFVVSVWGCCIAKATAVLIAARWIGGLGVGVSSMVSPLYISEISPPRIRGRMVTLFQFAITIGICLALFSNAGLQAVSEKYAGSESTGFWHYIVVQEVWRGMFGAEFVPAMLFLLLCLIIPESPRWLTKVGRLSEARKTIATVSGSAVADREIEEIKNVIAYEAGSVMQLFRPGLRKALFVALFLAIVSELSGITIVFLYGPGILEDAGFSLGGALGGFVPIGVVNVVFTIIAIWLMDKAGRRPLLFLGNLGCCISLFTIGILFSTNRTEGIILVFMICLFVACFAFSMGPIKWVVMSEIFPTRIRGRAVAIATLAVWGTDFIYNQFYPIVESKIGVDNSFFIFAAVLIPQFFFVWKIMPETKGRTLEEIEQSWTRTKSEPAEIADQPES
jgi:sugar porter (SP) family MFS transporter